MKPKQVISLLRDRKDIPLKYMPNKQQIGAYNCLCRKNLIEKEVQESKESLEKFLEAHALQNAKSQNDLICLESDLKAKNFLLIMTSKALLFNVIKQERANQNSFLHVDATYKLLRNGFCLLTLGTENSSHNFRFIACVITSHEDGNSYERFLKRIKIALKDIFDFNWNPSWAVSDAADSIANALSKIFPQTEHIRCYFHTVKAVRDKITRWKINTEKKVLKDNWGLILHALKLLHYTLEDEEFVNLWKLIKIDWEKQLPIAFGTYFEKNFVSNRNNLRWNRMSKLGVNLTNNSLERFHLDIKNTYTKNKKMKISEFLFTSIRMIRDYSIDHSDNFDKTPEISTDVWKKALRLLEKKEKGPYYDIKEDFAVFIKKKRDVKKFLERKK